MGIQMKAKEASRILNRIVDIDHQLEICGDINTVILGSSNSGVTLQGDQAKLLAAYWRKDLLETRMRLVEQINDCMIEVRA